MINNRIKVGTGNLNVIDFDCCCVDAAVSLQCTFLFGECFSVYGVLYVCVYRSTIYSYIHNYAISFVVFYFYVPLFSCDCGMQLVPTLIGTTVGDSDAD